jgi:hypothetical protein
MLIGRLVRLIGDKFRSDRLPHDHPSRGAGRREASGISGRPVTCINRQSIGGKHVGGVHYVLELSFP